jgi:nucleoside-diphosphate-sugar epimerase
MKSGRAEEGRGAPKPAVFVTGASGFIGRAFVARHAHELEITALVRPGKANALDGLPVRCIERELAGVRAADFSPGQTLLHFASAGVNPAESLGWERIFQVNVVDSLHCWREAVQAGVGKLLLIGSCSEYGLSAEREEFVGTASPLQPNTAYGASKAAAALAAHALAIDAGVAVKLLRLFHVYGEGEAPWRFWPALRRAALAGEDFDMTPGEQVRDFTEVGEACRQIRAHLDAFAPGPGFAVENIGSGQVRSLREFAEDWWTRLEAKGRLRPGRIPYRKGEVMRLVPRLAPAATERA